MLRISVLMLLLFTQVIYANELPDDCEAAVDAADRLNADSNKHCDYSKTGLNGVLHKALANKKSAPEPTANLAADTLATASLPQVVTREFDSAQQLSAVRYDAIQLASRECAAGFVVRGERYLPVAEKRLKLELSYQCL